MKNLIKRPNLLDSRSLLMLFVVLPFAFFLQVASAQDAATENQASAVEESAAPLANEEPSANEQPSADGEPSASKEPLEEVIVTGRKSTLAMEYQIIKAEDAVYDEYNKLNAGTQFEMICTPPKFRDNFTGLLPSARQRVCATRYVHDENAESLQDALAGFAVVDPVVEEHNKQVREKLLTLYNESPAFRDRISELIALRKSHQSVKAAEANSDEDEGFFKRLFGKQE